MKKTLDKTFDLAEDGLAARYRVRLYESEHEECDPERVLITSWEQDQPGQPLDVWLQRMSCEAFRLLHQQGGPLLLIEFQPERSYQFGGNLLTFAEEITMARIQPLEGGKLALLDFGEMARSDVERRIGESLALPQGATR